MFAFASEVYSASNEVNSTKNSKDHF